LRGKENNKPQSDRSPEKKRSSQSNDLSQGFERNTTTITEIQVKRAGSPLKNMVSNAMKSLNESNDDISEEPTDALEDTTKLDKS
jgi:hypothetical protein